MTNYKILVVDDEEDLCEILKFNLEVEGFSVDVAYNAEEALKKEIARYDLILLDVMMGETSGFKLARQLKSRPDTAQIPIIFCTAKDTEDDTVIGLEIGADDYITKPFSLMALRARVNNQIRKTRSSRLQVYQSRDFYFSFQRMEFSKGDRKVDLSRTEQKLLQLLVENRGLTLSRNELVERIWADSTQYADENALTVLVKRLRDKLEDNPGAPRYIKTVYGIGYTWADGRERLSAGAGRG